MKQSSKKTQASEYELAKELKMLAKIELNKVAKNASTYPYFHSMLKEKGGFVRAEDMILTYAIKNNVSVSAALGQLESSMSE